MFLIAAIKYVFMVFDFHFPVLLLKSVDNAIFTVEANVYTIPAMKSPCKSHDLAGCVNFTHKGSPLFVYPTLHLVNGIYFDLRFDKPNLSENSFCWVVANKTWSKMNNEK